ncbi:MAG: HAMP domain-containing histidine kinase, partial [Clostridia bacterium]|nr:HAMP domain-containing histidine kinase [Clostridia bacterium]
EINDIFLDEISGIISGIYEKNGNLIYGENPLGEKLLKKGFSNGIVQTLEIDNEKYYIFDRKLDHLGIKDVWLRGVVSENKALSEISDISKISFIILCVVIHIGVIVGIYIIDEVFRPIKKITEAAIKIGNSADLKERINMGEGKDEFKILANQFDKMVDKLDKTFESEKRFTSDASHELRTPVAVISAQCEYILESPREVEEYIEALEVISRQNKRMSSLINDMLSLSRFENKKNKYVFSEFDFSSSIDAICKDMSLIEKKNIKLSYNIEDNIILNGEKVLLERLALNLISNAFKYGKENGSIFVSLKKDEKKGKVRLSVSDNGIGISDEEKEKIFDRFYRSDKSRSESGTGLGLSLVSEIAKLHGGVIELESKLNEGSTFTFIV